MLSVHGCPLGRLGTREAGGMQAYVRQLSQELGRRGVLVDVFTRRSDPDLPTIVVFGEGARVIHLDAGPAAPVEKAALYDLLPEFVGNLDRFRRAEGRDYRLIHSHYWLSGWVGTILARRWAVPHLTMFHTLARLKNRALHGTEPDDRIDVETRVIARVDRVIAATEHERQALVELYGARRERVAVIPCGVDLERFRPVDRAAARARLGLCGDVLLFVGRIDPIKGLDVLVRAVGLLRDRPDLTLVVAGGPGDEAELERVRGLIETLGLRDKVQLRGAVPQEELPDYYSAASVCVVPSHYESFGLAAIEALACGTPVVASHVGGLPTVVRDGENGLLVRWRWPEAFAAAIARVLDDPSFAASLAGRARESVLRFGWGRVAEAVLEQYRQVEAACQPAVACSERG
jgi:D-inositol-3-phosphate glycosyltransferase